MAGSEDDSPAERSLSASRNLYLVFRADPADRGRGFLAGEARLPTDPMLVSGSWRESRVALSRKMRRLSGFGSAFNSFFSVSATSHSSESSACFIYCLYFLAVILRS